MISPFETQPNPICSDSEVYILIIICLSDQEVFPLLISLCLNSGQNTCKISKSVSVLTRFIQKQILLSSYSSLFHRFLLTEMR